MLEKTREPRKTVWCQSSYKRASIKTDPRGTHQDKRFSSPSPGKSLKFHKNWISLKNQCRNISSLRMNPSQGTETLWSYCGLFYSLWLTHSSPGWLQIVAGKYSLGSMVRVFSGFGTKWSHTSVQYTNSASLFLCPQVSSVSYNAQIDVPAYWTEKVVAEDWVEVQSKLFPFQSVP